MRKSLLIISLLLGHFLSFAQIDYEAHFSNCTFTVDDNNLFAANGTDLLAHVSLWEVKGVEFTNCRFEDARTGNHSRKSAIRMAIKLTKRLRTLVI